MPDQDRALGSPPPLHDQVTLSSKQVHEAERILADLSEGLGSLPVVLSQDGTVIARVGVADPAFAEHIAKVIDRTWREGATKPARELIRFEEEIQEEATGRSSYLLYSVHVAGALVLTIGWHMSLPITQVRAEIGKARATLARLIIT